jgi:ATP-dependent Lon protease
MTITLPLDRGEARQVFLVPRHGAEYAKVGVVGRVVERLRLPGSGTATVITGLNRAVAGAAQTGSDGHLSVEVQEKPDETPPPVRTQKLEREYRAVVEEILDLRGADDQVHAFVRSITAPGALADTSGYAPDLTFVQKVQIWRRSTW